MKKLILNILAISALSFNANSQINDTVAYRPTQQENLPPPIGTIPAKFAAVQTLTGSNLRLTDDWTIEAWVKVVFPANQIHIVETYGFGNTGGFALRLTGSKIHAYQIANPTANNTVIGNTTIPAGEWHHIAATLNETTQELKVYLDGVLDGTVTATIPTENTNPGLNIGARGDDNQVTGIVEIDNVKIWEKAKTETEIQSDTLACLTGNEVGLVAWYNFEDNSSATLIDISGNNNNGTYMNFDGFDFNERIYTCHEPSSASVIENEIDNVTLYPNPTRNELSIDLNGLQPVNLSIIDITGKTVVKWNKNIKTINVSELVNGVYFVQLQTNDKIISKKFIKH
jgi:hypothetical protein